MAVRLSALRSGRTLLPRKTVILLFLVLISVRGRVSQGLARPEGLRKLNNFTSSGLEPATFRLEA
jgi:hypothetical protein